jgi:predicted dehydrogenase
MGKIHLSKYQHSFPRRFAQAFALEMDAFADAILGNKAWPITEQDCIRVQRIADAAQESCQS